MQVIVYVWDLGICFGVKSPKVSQTHLLFILLVWEENVNLRQAIRRSTALFPHFSLRNLWWGVSKQITVPQILTTLACLFSHRTGARGKLLISLFQLSIFVNIRHSKFFLGYFVVLIYLETGSRYVGPTGLEFDMQTRLVSDSEPPFSPSSQVLGLKGQVFCFCFFFSFLEPLSFMQSRPASLCTPG